MDSTLGRLKVKLRYLRVDLFYSALRPFQRRTRLRRMAKFIHCMNVREGDSILDLGGQPQIWDNVPCRLNITILNLPGIAQQEWGSHHNIRYVIGDATHAPEYSNAQFDIVFSNSVIEHVGADAKQADFAAEVQRIGGSYWIQTPSKYFPIEAHCGMPFWWFYPASWQRYFISRWREKLPGWTEMVEGTRVLTRKRVRALFPAATVFTERTLGIPKSYIAYRARPAAMR